MNALFHVRCLQGLARISFLVVILVSIPTWADVAVKEAVSEEFTELFDGQSLDGWRGRPHFDPREEAALEAEERLEKQKEWNDDRDKHWSVDRENREIVSDGSGVYLTTTRQYGDFELHLDWKMVSERGDSGIYLRGSPQVQIWDPSNPGAVKHGVGKGSGALWNNNPDNPGRWPLVKADRPVGEWNDFRIRMVGSRVWVWFNDQLTVDGAIMNNYWDRDIPMFSEGCIQLQTHGSETRFRNVRIREIDSQEANRLLADHGDEGYVSIFNGEDFTGWSGPTAANEIADGSIVSKKGTIYTDKVWTDFSVQFEFQLPAGANNGLAIRYPGGKEDTAYMGMCELQVLDSEHEKYAELDARQYHGSAYGMIAAHRGYLRSAGEWNFQRVSVEGTRIRVELNGTVILDGDLADVKEFMGGTAHPGKERSDGHFGFAAHGDPVRYRRVMAKELSSSVQ